jgi:hypothetical protein
VICNEVTLSLGVYLVGALEPAERSAVEAHLATCADCQRELDELAALPSMLDLLRIEDVESIGIGPSQAAALGVHDGGPSIAPSEDLFERFAAKARGEQTPDELAAHRNRKSKFTRFRVLTSSAAAVVVIGAGIGIGVAASGGGQHHNANHISAQQGSVQMDVTLASQIAGTSLDLEVAGLPDDEHCRLVAIGKDGSRDQVGQWNATYAGKAKFWGSTAIPRSELSQIVLLGTNGKPLVTASV